MDVWTGCCFWIGWFWPLKRTCCEAFSIRASSVGDQRHHGWPVGSGAVDGIAGAWPQSRPRSGTSGGLSTRSECVFQRLPAVPWSCQDHGDRRFPQPGAGARPPGRCVTFGQLADIYRTLNLDAMSVLPNSERAERRVTGPDPCLRQLTAWPGHMSQIDRHRRAIFRHAAQSPAILDTLVVDDDPLCQSAPHNDGTRCKTQVLHALTTRPGRRQDGRHREQSRSLGMGSYRYFHVDPPSTPITPPARPLKAPHSPVRPRQLPEPQYNTQPVAPAPGHVPSGAGRATGGLGLISFPVWR